MELVKEILSKEWCTPGEARIVFCTLFTIKDTEYYKSYRKYIIVAPLNVERDDKGNVIASTPRVLVSQLEEVIDMFRENFKNRIETTK